MKMRAGNNSPIWRRDNANNETEKCIKIVSEEFDPPLKGTIKKIEIELHRHSRSFSLRKLLKLKHTRPLDE
jgi:hypothetical protein